MEVYMERFKWTVVVVFVLSICCMPVRAEIIRIGLTAVVDNVADSYNLLGNKIHRGDTITGFYIYDSSTPNSDPQPTYYGSYRYTTAPYGMSLIVGGITFQTDSTNVNFGIGVLHNFYGDPGDDYVVGSVNNLPLSNEVTVASLHWQLSEYTGTALSGTELPLTPPDLTKWPGMNALRIGGGIFSNPQSPNDPTFAISSHVTNAFLVPEPISLCLMALGGLLLRRKF
jgi:hypothetical protein